MVRENYVAKLPENKKVDSAEFEFSTTAELEPAEGLDQIIGQDDALRKITNILRTERATSNVLCLGDPGVGKSFSIVILLDKVNHYLNKGAEYMDERKSEEREKREHPFVPTLEEMVIEVAEVFRNNTLADQVALYNFKRSTRPKAIALPVGYAREFADDLSEMTKNIRQTSSMTSLAGVIGKYNKQAQKLDFGNFRFRIRMAKADGPPGLTKAELIPLVERVILPEDKEEVERRNIIFDDLISEMMEKMAEADGAAQGDQWRRPEADGAPQADQWAPSPKDILKEYQDKVDDLSFKNYIYRIQGDLLSDRLRGSPFVRPPDLISVSKEDLFRGNLNKMKLLDLYKECMRNLGYMDPEDPKVRVISVNDSTKIESMISRLKEKWGSSEIPDFEDREELLEWFDHVADDLKRNIMEYIREEEQRVSSRPTFDKFEVNILVDNSGTEGIPLVTVENPSLDNLFGKAGHDALNNTAEHTRLDAGGLIEADGGVLYLDEGITALSKQDLLNHFLTAMQNEEVRIGGGRGLSGGGTSGNIESEPFKARVRYIMNVNRNALKKLEEYPQMKRRAVMVRFGSVMEDTLENRLKFGNFYANELHRYNVQKRTGKDKNLPPLTAEAVAYAVEMASAVSGSRGELTNNLDLMAKIGIKAAMVARDAGSDATDIEHIKWYMQNRINETKAEREEMINDVIREGIITMQGDKLGKVNGLAVRPLQSDERQERMIGSPLRIEATIPGPAPGITLIETDSGLAGNITMQGFNIGLTYLMNQYSDITGIRGLDATVSFPLLRNEVEGNSASVAGIIALLSKISGVKVYQGICVTGASVGNEGEVGRIGGAYAKVRGAYDFAVKQGILGNSSEPVGAMIPRQNYTDLLQEIVFDEELCDAVKSGKFNIYLYNSIDDAIEILTDRDASEFHDKVREGLHKHLDDGPDNNRHMHESSMPTPHPRKDIERYD